MDQFTSYCLPVTVISYLPKYVKKDAEMVTENGDARNLRLKSKKLAAGKPRTFDLCQ